MSGDSMTANHLSTKLRLFPDHRGRTAGTCGEQRIARDGLAGCVVDTSVFTKLLPKRESRGPIIHMASTKFGPIPDSHFGHESQQCYWPSSRNFLRRREPHQ